MLPTNPQSRRQEELRKLVEADDAAMQKGLSTDPTQPTEVKEDGSPLEVTEVTVEETEVTVKPEKDLTYWKDRCLVAENRFNVTKAKLDTNIRNLRLDLRSLKEEKIKLAKDLNQARQELSTTVVSDLDKLVSQTNIDVLGVETATAIKDALDATNAKLEEQQRKLDSDRLAKEEADLIADRNNEWNAFVDRLRTLVPKLDKLNTDKEFLAWLEEPDELTGDIRADILGKAQEVRDAGRIAQIFNSFKAVPVTPKDSISKRVAPAAKGGSDSVANIQDKGTISINVVNQFYKDAQRGLYKGRNSEKLAMEARIEKAYAAGKIVG